MVRSLIHVLALLLSPSTESFSWDHISTNNLAFIKPKMQHSNNMKKNTKEEQRCTFSNCQKHIIANRITIFASAFLLILKNNTQLKMLITGLIRPRVWRRDRIKPSWNVEMRGRKDEKMKRCKWWFWGAFLIGRFFYARVPLFWYSDTHKSQWPKTMTDLAESLTAAFGFLNLCLLLTLANGTKGVKDGGKRESRAVRFKCGKMCLK